MVLRREQALTPVELAERAKTEAAVRALPGRLRLYSALYPTLELTLSKDVALQVAIDLERGIKQRDLENAQT